MTIPASMPVRATYTGDSATVNFPIPFKYFANNDGTKQVKVYLADSDGGNQTELTENTDFTMTAAGSANGTLTMITAPETGKRITIVYAIPIEQVTDWEEFGRLPSKSIEDAVDKLTAILKQQKEVLDRCVKVEISDPRAPELVFTDFRTEMQNKVAAAAGSATSASSSATLAEQWATKTSGKVDSTNYSAKYYAIYATEKADNAANSATAAAESANAAEAAKIYAETAVTDENLIAVATDLADEESYIKAAIPNATAAAGSATAAAASASAAASAASNAENSANAAAESARLAGLSKTAAENAANHAADNSVSAGQSATAAGISELNSANSAATATAAKTAAATSETNASNSATAAAGSATAAAASATAAATSETNAANSAIAAAGSATDAATSANAAAESANAAKQWAIGVPGEPSGGSAKYWAERAEDAASGLENPANRDLSNLTADGQKIIDTVDGKISNCMLEIPQNLKLEISGDTFTIKSGSTIVLVGATYTTYTLTSDTIVDYSTNLPNVSNGLYYIFANSNGTVTRSAWIKITNCFSGTPLPNASDYPNSSVFFETSEKKKWYNNNGTWIDLGGSYPLGLFEVKNHQLSFAKDSNGNDMIFNGMGFIGHHIFIYPNINAYMPAGLNPDGSLASTKVNTNALRIIEALSGYGVDSLKRWISLQSNHAISNWSAYKEVNHDSEADYSVANIRYYARDINLIKRYNSGSVSAVDGVPLVEYYYDGSNITSFTPKQCARLVTVDMLPDSYTKDQVDTKLANKQDTLVSGTNIKTINSTTVLGNGNFTLADQSLSNLNSDGQMIIDTQNGTISNCVLDIPQNIKLTLENNVLTLKAGSVLTRTGETYATVTVTEDKTSTYGNNGKYYIIATADGTLYNWWRFDKTRSGSILPEDGTNYKYFFNITDKKLYSYGENGWDIWRKNTQCYPLGIIEVTNGVASFAKDSNGNDMVFNGAGFIGHHAFVYPNVKVLRPNEFNSDGSFRSINTTLNSLLIFEMGSTSNAITINGTTTGSTRKYFEVENLDTSLQGFQYVKSENVDYFWNGAEYVKRYETKVIDFSVTGTTVNSFAIVQPVRLATTEMLDKVQDQVDTNTTAIDGKLDKVTETSGTMQLYAKNTDGSQYMINAAQQPAVNSVARRTNTGTLAVATPTAGDDATNKSYVDSLADTQNGTISNCVLDIPQNLKLEINSGVVTLKAGSVITLAQSTYATITTTVDKTYNASLSSDSTYFLFIDSSGMYLSLFAVATAVSGETDSLAGLTYHTWFDTTNKVINRYSSDPSTPSSTLAYPLCVIIKDSNGVRFAKDSNGNDMIFNGACFVGHHAVIYPNVKVLIPDEFNADGSLKSISSNINSLIIRELSYNRIDSTVFLAQSGSINIHRQYFVVDRIKDIDTTKAWSIWYVKSINKCYTVDNNAQFSAAKETILCKYSSGDSVVTDFTICQPVQTATVEMLNEKQDLLTFDNTPTQNSTNPVTSGGLYNVLGDIETLINAL